MYPKEVLTKNKAGQEEARILVDQGKFIRYKYINTKTGQEDNKVSLILNKEHYYIISLKGNRKLMIKNTESESKAIFDPESEEVIKW